MAHLNQEDYQPEEPQGDILNIEVLEGYIAEGEWTMWEFGPQGEKTLSGVYASGR